MKKFESTILDNQNLFVSNFNISQDGTVMFNAETVENIIKEREYWRREALTYAAQLGEIRIWLAQLGCTPEKVLEDCKTMFPDRKVY